MSEVQALIHRAATGRPFSILKYAMTADGKIATSAGHAAWVSCAESRARVFAARARSDAVIVGGNTVRRDNPRLTTRAKGGHTPVRIVMSRTLELPEVGHLSCCVLIGLHGCVRRAGKSAPAQPSPRQACRLAGLLPAEAQHARDLSSL